MQNCRLIVLLLVSLAGLCMLSAPALTKTRAALAQPRDVVVEAR
jgi:hypothetical protein